MGEFETYAEQVASARQRHDPDLSMHLMQEGVALDPEHESNVAAASFLTTLAAMVDVQIAGMSMDDPEQRRLRHGRLVRSILKDLHARPELRQAVASYFFGMENGRINSSSCEVDWGGNPSPECNPCINEELNNTLGRFTERALSRFTSYPYAHEPHKSVYRASALPGRGYVYLEGQHNPVDREAEAIRTGNALFLVKDGQEKVVFQTLWLESSEGRGAVDIKTIYDGQNDIRIIRKFMAAVRDDMALGN